MSFKNGVTGDQHSFARLAPFLEYSWNTCSCRCCRPPGRDM